MHDETPFLSPTDTSLMRFGRAWDVRGVAILKGLLPVTEAWPVDGAHVKKAGLCESGERPECLIH